MLKQSGDTILLVEDEEPAILLVQQAVAGCPGNLYLAVVPDSVSALDWLSAETARDHPLPRLILIDLKLPKLIGLAVLRTLRMDQRLQHVPVIVIRKAMNLRMWCWPTRLARTVLSKNRRRWPISTS